MRSAPAGATCGVPDVLAFGLGREVAEVRVPAPRVVPGLDVGRVSDRWAVSSLVRVGLVDGSAAVALIRPVEGHDAVGECGWEAERVDPGAAERDVGAAGQCVAGNGAALDGERRGWATEEEAVPDAA